MKRQLIILSAVLALGLGGCGEQGQGEETSSAPISTDGPAAVTELVGATVPPEPTETPPEVPAVTEMGEDAPESPDPDGASELEKELDPVERPSDVEVLDAYYAALEAYGWFAGEDKGLMLDEADEEVRPDMVYCRVTRPGLEDLDHLRGYLKELFSDEVVDGLMEHSTRFLETEAGLYAQPAGGGEEGAGGPLMLIVLWPEGEAAYSCTVQATVSPDGAAEEDIHEAIYQKVGDKWVFTDFDPIF